MSQEAAGRMPKPLGPYAHVVRAGEFLFTAGQPGLDVDTGEVSDGFRAQARHAFENLARVLEASGSSLQQVVKTTVFLADPTAFGELNALYAEYFPLDPPARSTPIVQLPRGLLISIEAVAYLGPRAPATRPGAAEPQEE